MKPWEEDWYPLIWMHDGNQRPIWAVESKTNKRPGPPGPLLECNDPDEEGVARLAAAAPLMARMLLTLHADHGPRHTFDWAYFFEEIEKVLDVAGVEYQDPADT
jgi:hypothetical protein